MKIPDNSHHITSQIPKKSSGNGGSVTAHKTRETGGEQKAQVNAKQAPSPETLLSMLKLPQDSLSRSVLAFARFFSIPFEFSFLNELRQFVLVKDDLYVAAFGDLMRVFERFAGVRE